MLWVSLAWTFNFYLNLAHHTVYQRWLYLRKLSTLAPISKKKVPNQAHQHFSLVENCSGPQGHDLAPFCGDQNQSEKLEIKPPLTDRNILHEKWLASISCLSVYQGLQTCVCNFKFFHTTSHNNGTLLICPSFQFLLVVLLRFWLFSSHFQVKMNVFRFPH